METHLNPNSLVQPTQNTKNQSTMTQTVADKAEKNKYKLPILSDRESDLSKTKPRMWWEHISEYIHLTYNHNLDNTMD